MDRISIFYTYRDSTDDGVLTALLLAPLIASACFYTSSANAPFYATAPALPNNWLIEAPIVLTRPGAWTAAESLLRSRHALVQLSSLTSSLLLTHLFASRMYEGYCRSRKTCLESERASVPRSEWLRSRLYIAFAVLSTLSAVGVKVAFARAKLGIWKGLSHLGTSGKPYLNAMQTLDLSTLDVLAAAAFYQLVLYLAMRLAHHSLTLGELGLASFGAVILFIETMHVTCAKVSRSPDPISRNLNLASDVANHDTVSQDIPASHSPSILPAGAHPRHYTRRSITRPATIFIEAYRPAAFTQATLSGGKAASPSLFGDWLLPRRSPHHRRPSRHVDEMVLEWSGSVGMGCLLHSWGQDEMDASIAARLLGHARALKRSGMGTTVVSLQEIQA